jgi:hypothetical protein
MRSDFFKWLLWCIALTGSPVFATEPVSIITHPADQTVEEGRYAVFSVTATGSNLRYRWFSNNIPILPLAMATNATYQSPVARLAMNGTIYHVVVSNAQGSVRSSNAVLTVVQDRSGPRIQLVTQWIGEPNSLRVDFSETVTQASAENEASYAVHRLGLPGSLSVTQASWGGSYVRLRLNSILDLNSDYVVCINGLADSRGNLTWGNCLGAGFSTTNMLVSFGAIWRYNEHETNSLPPSWVTLNYNDNPEVPPYHWWSDYGAFGFDTVGQTSPCLLVRTPLSIGRTTYYFRKRLSVTDRFPPDAMLRLWHFVDDGAVFYLNGNEIYRTRMPPGPIEYSTLATNISDALCAYVDLPVVHLLADGANILAVEVHQAMEPEPTNTDVAFDAGLGVLFRRTPAIPTLHVTYTPSAAVLNWQGVGWSLERAGNLSGPWSRATTSTNEYVSPFGLPGERRFFRLVNP